MTTTHMVLDGSEYMEFLGQETLQRNSELGDTNWGSKHSISEYCSVKEAQQRL